MRSKLRIYPTPGLSLLLCSGSGGILVWDGSAELWANIHWPCVASCLCWIIAEPTRHRLRWLLKITVALERGWDHDGCAGIAAPQISSELAEHPAAPLSPPAHPSELLTWAIPTEISKPTRQEVCLKDFDKSPGKEKQESLLGVEAFGGAVPGLWN